MSIGGFFGSGGIVTGMVRLAGITSILVFLSMALGLTAGRNQPLDVMFFIKFYLIYAIFVMTPAYRININDVTTGTTKPITLTSGAMIPIGLVVINSYTSTLFYDLTQAYQKYFEVGTDSSATYTKGGLSFGSNFVTNLPRFSSGDADFEQNTTEYIANCALPLSYSQFGGINNLMSSTDMFGAFASIPNQGSRFVMYVDSSGKSNAIGCDQSLTQLQTYWSGHKDVFLKNISNQAGFNTTKLQTIFSAAANSSANSLLGVTSSSGSDALKQAMIMNMTYRAVQTSATKVNNAALANAAYDAQQFQQYQAGGMLSSEQAGRLVPALKSFMEVMMIMIYPLMVFFALMTSSFKPVFKYMQIAATYRILNSYRNYVCNN
jgi:hypothetical protein